MRNPPLRRRNDGVTRRNHTPTNPLRSCIPAHATSAVLCGRPHGDQKVPARGISIGAVHVFNIYI